MRDILRRGWLVWTGLALLVMAFSAFGAFTLHAEDAMTVTGQVSATDQEADEGYFAVGHETMIVARPGSDLHKWLRGHAGQRVTLTLDPVPTSE